VQRTLPHEHAIDGILIPSVRDRMILLRGKYDLVEAFHGYVTEVCSATLRQPPAVLTLPQFTLHGDDALDHRNWEASEKWLKDFAMLVDDELYTITNRWRAVRGVPPLTRPPDPVLESGMGTGANLVGEFLGLGGAVAPPQGQVQAHAQGH
jgi:hypothetical protein